MSYRKVVKMYRDEAVKIMSDTIDNFNRQQAELNGVPSEQIEEYISAQREQMDFVNGMVYDVLKDSGVIA